MPHNYYGDISGTLDENIDIYTLENLGLELDEYYTWTCGCKTTLDEPTDCDCEIEGENVQSENITYIEINVYEEDIETIKEALNDILSDFGEDREEYFNMRLNNSQEQSSFSEDKLITYKELYGLYKFGTELYEYLVDATICSFHFLL
jgi:hypothetical protein